MLEKEYRERGPTKIAVEILVFFRVLIVKKKRRFRGYAIVQNSPIVPVVIIMAPHSSHA